MIHYLVAIFNWLVPPQPGEARWVPKRDVRLAVTLWTAFAPILAALLWALWLVLKSWPQLPL